MSGIEIVGVVLGAFPLAISAMEHYQDTKKAAGTFWKIRKAYRKDVRNFELCRTMFVLHVKELLRPLVEIDIDDDPEKCTILLQEPGGNLWKHQEVEEALKRRLHKQHKVYMNTMEELLEVMAKLARETRAFDIRFQQLLEDPRTTNTQTELMRIANARIKTIFQARRVHYSLTGNSREALLTEAETYIRRLRDLLSAVDRLSQAEPSLTAIRTTPTPKFLLQFWRHAERIYRLLRKAMICDCRLMHCAALWLQDQAKTPVSVSIHLLFTKALESAASPWREKGIMVRHAEDSPPCPTPASKPSVRVQSVTAASTSLGSSSKFSHAKKITRVSFQPQPAAPSTSPDLSDEGLCRALSNNVEKQTCFGTLIDIDEQVQYDVLSEPSVCVRAIGDVSAYQLLQRLKTRTAAFHRVQRCKLALNLATAQLKFHSTQWIHSSWTLERVLFPQKLASTGDIDHYAPYLIADFESNTKGKSSVSITPDQTFWTLGVVLLELWFGELLKDHGLFTDPAYARNFEDPLVQRAVVYQWAQEVELDAGSDYACAVKWCLHQSPVSDSDGKWRNDFAQNVIQPLQRCCTAMQSGTK